MIHHDIGTGARGNQVEWTATCGGDGSIAGWKDRDPKNAEACNMLLSEIQHHFFSASTEGLTWFEAADMLGFKRLSDVKGEEDPRAKLRELFRVGTATPDAESDPNFQGRGWKVFHLDTGPADILDAFRRAIEACGGDPNDDRTWEAFRSIQWVDVLGVKGARCTCRWRGRKVGLKWADPNGVMSAPSQPQAA